MKKLLAILLATLTIVLSCGIVFAANNTTFSIWTENNIYVGDEETSNLASKLNRENLAYIIVEAFDIETKYRMDIQDVPKDNPFYEYICAVVATGIMPLDEGTNKFFPKEYVKREEIPQYFKFLDISYPAVGELPFKDLDSISSDMSEEDKDLFKRFITAGYLQPVSGNYLLPTRIVTITETINMLNKMFPNVPNKAFKNTIYDGHFLLKGSNTYLSDIEITGDLVITEGIILKNKNFANNEVSIDNVKVHGNIYIMNGSLLGKFSMNNVQAENIVVVGEEPIIISFENCKFEKLNLGSSLGNIVSDKEIIIERD